MLAAREIRFRLISSQETSLGDRNWATKVIPAMETFRQEFGHCIVDEDFEVPSSAPWPEAAWGMALGVVVREVREGASFLDQAARDRGRLELLRFPWDRQAAVWNDRIFPALEVYAAEVGHCRVPFMFVVPPREPWPRSAWGMNLGTTVASMRGMGSYFAFVGRDVDRLDELGYSLELPTRVWTKCVAPLVATYATLFGDEVPIPAAFVIPFEAPWSEETWGVRLGVIVARNARHVIKDTAP
ncbi:uncharacterized protein KRP23_13255 [Phytophthora ramorum]|nr:hypothetical protein KRP23_13255 [Phytophthora ramorum]